MCADAFVHHFCHSTANHTCATMQIFDLYTNLAMASHVPSTDGTGLGFVDSKMGTLHISIEVPRLQRPEKARKTTRRSSSSAGDGTNHRSKGTKAHAKPLQMDVTEVDIQQDLARLHGRGGHTGSVVWRAR